MVEWMKRQTAICRPEWDESPDFGALARGLGIVQQRTLGDTGEGLVQLAVKRWVMEGTYGLVGVVAWRELNDDADTFIVATEAGILHQMELKSPNKTFIPAPPNNTCACNDCPHMKRNTMEKLYLAMKYELPEIHLEDWVIEKGRRSIDKMLEISAKAGL